MNVTPSGAGMSGTPRSPQMFGTGDALKAKASTMKPTTTSYVNPGATGMPPGNAGEPGQAAGGGMYGAGEGAESSEEDTLKALLGKSVAEGDGEKRTPKEPEDEKTAAIDPSDWDTSMGMPTGFHRPTSEQPEALEPGGERFHSTDGKGADYGAGEGMRMKATSGHQLGKHASANSSPPRFLGTSFAMDKLATGYASERSHEFTSSLGEAARGIGRAADEGVKSVTKSPAASLIAAVLLGRLGFKGAKGAGRLGLRGIRRLRGKAPPVPKSTAEKLTEGAKSVGRRLGIVS